MRVHGTTIVTVRHKGRVAIGGDGQVAMANTVLKGDATKIRALADGNVLVGFAGATADAFTLLELFEAKLKDFQGHVPRAATEMAKQWRMDRTLRRLDALIAVVDRQHSLLITGQGDVLQPSDGVIGIGSGGQFACAAARALLRHSQLSASDIVREALLIAAEIDVYTNTSIQVEELECSN